MKKEPKIAKLFISLIGFTCVGSLMFMLGRISNSDIVEVSNGQHVMVTTKEKFNYLIESNYISADVDFKSGSNK